MDRISKAIKNANVISPKGENLFELDDIRYHHLSERRLAENLVINLNQNSHVSNAYRLLRTRLLQKVRSHHWNIIGITSADQHSGKSLTAVNLAVALAKDMNQTVVLIDSDIHDPQIGLTFGIKSQVGLNTFLASENHYTKHLVRTQIENLLIMPCNNDEALSSEILTGPRMRGMLNELRGIPQFIVICDLPCALVGDDVIAMSAYLDAYMLVISDGKTQIKDLEKTQRLLETTPFAGSVLNNSNERASHQ